MSNFVDPYDAKSLSDVATEKYREWLKAYYEEYTTTGMSNSMDPYSAKSRWDAAIGKYERRKACYEAYTTTGMSNSVDPYDAKSLSDIATEKYREWSKAYHEAYTTTGMSNSVDPYRAKSLWDAMEKYIELRNTCYEAFLPWPNPNEIGESYRVLAAGKCFELKAAALASIDPNENEDRLRLFADQLEKTNRQRASWNDFLTEFLLQSLQCFPRAQRGGWSDVTWKTVAKEITEKFPKSNFTIEQLKQKEKDMRKLYKLIKQILSRPGFQWDDKNCKLDASKDCWNQLIKETDGKLSGYRKKKIPYYAALIALNEGHVEVELETKFAKMQIGAREDAGHQACANFDGTSVNLSSPNADKMVPPLSPGFWGSPLFADDHSNDNSRTFPSNPLSSPFNPQNNHNNNPINPYLHAGTSGPSNFQPSSDFAQDQPLDSTNIPPFGVSALNDCENPSLFLASEGSMNYTNISPINLQSPTFPTYAPLLKDCENQSLFNNDTDIPHHQSFSAPLCQTNALNSENQKKKDNLSLERDPLRKIRGKRNSKKKGAAKFDYSMERCIKLFHTLQGFEIPDIEPTVEIFKNELNRKAFIAMETTHKAFWLRSKLNKGN